MSRALRNLFCLFLLAALATGCQQQTDNEDTSAGGGGDAAADGNGDGDAKPIIGASLLTFKNPFFKVIGDHIEEEAEKHGYDAIVLSADEDVRIQSDQIENFINQKVAAIVLSPCRVDAIGEVIKSANEAGIPVFTVDIPCDLPDVKIVSQIATDNYSGGKEAGHAMIEALGDAGGKVVILHYKQAESCILRVKGFTEVIDEHNKTAENAIEVVMELEGGGDKEIGRRAAEDAIQAQSELAGIFAINDPSALGARAALESAGRADDVVIIGFDGQPEGKQAIKEGKIYADPIQFPDQMGIKVVETIVAYSNGEEVEPEILIPTSLYRQADGLADPELE